MINSPAFFARTIATTHRSLGLKMPKTYDTAEADLNRINSEGSSLGTKGGSLAHAVAAAVISKRDPSTDPEVTRLVVAERISGEGILIGVREAVEQRLTDALTDNVHQIIEQYITLFDQAAETIQTTAAILGNVNLDRDTAEILNRGGDIAKHYLAAREANATLKEIAGVWAMLATTTRQADPNPEWRALVLSPVTLDDWETLQLRGSKRSPWELYHLGLTLKLPTVPEYHQRLNAHDTARDQRVVDHRNSLKFRA